MTFRFKIHEAKDLDGFIKILVYNGYKVSFRPGGNSNIWMCDIDDDQCVARNTSKIEDVSDNSVFVG